MIGLARRENTQIQERRLRTIILGGVEWAWMTR